MKNQFMPFKYDIVIVIASLHSVSSITSMPAHSTYNIHDVTSRQKGPRIVGKLERYVGVGGRWGV